MNRKRKVKRQVIRDKSRVTRTIPTETQELRQRRMRRYQKRRAVLKTSQMKPGRSSVEVSPALSLPKSDRRRSRRNQATILGQTQTKRVCRQRIPKQNVHRGQLQPKRPPLSHVETSRMVRRKRARRSFLLFRLLIAGVGVALIAGFAIALLHPESPEAGATKSGSLQFQEPKENVGTPEVVKAVATSVYEKPGKELRQLKQEIRGLVDQEPDLATGLFFLNPETQEFVTHRGAESFPAASMIKLPVLIAFFQDVDEGKIQLDEQLIMRPDLIATEAGAMQYDQPNSEYNALQVADWMITISDNTATNMIIDRLGGQETLNQRFQEWGLEQTKINQPLPDLEGMNTMSPKDLAVLMAQVSQGDLLTAHSRDRAFEILRHTVTNTLLPQGIGEGAQIAHKTGDIGMAVGDAGLIDMPNGQRYVAGIVVKRPHNDPRAQELIRALSRLTYKVFSERPVPRTQKPDSEIEPILDQSVE